MSINFNLSTEISQTSVSVWNRGSGMGWRQSGMEWRHYRQVSLRLLHLGTALVSGIFETSASLWSVSGEVRDDVIMM